MGALRALSELGDMAFTVIGVPAQREAVGVYLEAGRTMSPSTVSDPHGRRRQVAQKR
jgi:hypothetical protein